jgi:hypothetical protein
MIICHPSYPPQILTINAPNNWTITSINFGATIPAPTGVSAATTLTAAANSWSYGYAVTAVDINGQESVPSTSVTILNVQSLQSNAGTNIISWTAVPGAQSYNVYKASPIFNTTFAGNSPEGFIGNTIGVSFTDANPGFAPDFAQTPPIAENPFQGAGVQSYTVTAAGSYTTVPTVSVTGGSPTAQATAQAQLGIISSSLVSGGGGFVVGQIYNIGPIGVTFGSLQVLTVGGGGALLTYNIVWQGSITSGSTPTNPLTVLNLQSGINGSINATWGVVAVNSIQGGAGYTSVPSVGFSPAGAAATAFLSAASAGNPGVPDFFQERLVLAAQAKAVQAINLSQPGSFFNFNVSFPIEADDAITTQIISSELNDIKSLTQVPTGFLALTSKGGWLINGGGGIATADPITPVNITAQAQAFNGANDIRPLKINMDVLYVTKSNYVRDLAYNIYATIFTGSDISVLSNHLFFDFFLTQWCWSEEPFKTVWAIRNDGILLSLAYVKEQELIGWAHHDTNGQFMSVCSIAETVPSGDTVDMVYFVVRRQLPNGQYRQYVERLASRYFIYGYEDSWSVDCALQTVPFQGLITTSLDFVISGNASVVGSTVTITDIAGFAPFTSIMATNNYIFRGGGGIYKITGFTSGSVVTAQVVRVPANIDVYTGIAFPSDGSVWQPVTTVTGLTQLIGQQVTGVADGVVVPLTTVSPTGTVTLAQPATKVTLGLPFLPQLQTLPLDLGEPTVQSKRKKLPAATMRVADTLGLQIGTSFANVTTMKDFQIGAIPSQSNGPALVADLFSGDGRQILDQVWQEPGQLCVQQNLPYPATILGVMPEVVVGDTPDKGGGR